MRWNAQWSNDVIEELLHRENVQIQPVAGNGGLGTCIIAETAESAGAGVRVDAGVGLGTLRRATDVEVLEVGSDRGTQALFVAAENLRVNIWYCYF